jgi:RNA polymerase sigma-70 factor (ECF subfamily)
MLMVAATLVAVPHPHRTKRPSAEVRALPFAFADDAELATALAARHPAAPRALWDRFAALVRRLLQRALTTSDVDDVTQDAFMRVLALAPRIREPEKLRSFVVGVSMRVAREELRRRRVRRWLRFGAELPEQAEDGPDYPAAEALAHLDAVVHRLDDKTRIVFVLRFVEDMSTVDVAEALGCSLATAKRRVQRARTLVEAAAARDEVLSSYLRAGGDDG